MRKGIVLIGFMGAGKSSIGRVLSRRLRMPFVDTDRYVERQAGTTIAQIFAHAGEAVFRDMEHRALEELLKKPPAIIATGGGVVTREDNWPLLERLGTVIYLRGNSDTLFERVSRHSHRPLLKAPNPRETFDTLLQGRKPLYEKAELTVDTDESRSEEVAERVVGALKQAAR
jgi:shikimate kinase